MTTPLTTKDGQVTSLEAFKLGVRLSRTTENIFVLGEFGLKLEKGMTIADAEKFVKGQEEAMERRESLALLRKIYRDSACLMRVEQINPKLAAEARKQQEENQNPVGAFFRASQATKS